MANEILRSVMNTCGCDKKKEAIQSIKSEIETARENCILSEVNMKARL